jgi:hypothetical protein
MKKGSTKTLKTEEEELFFISTDPSVDLKTHESGGEEEVEGSDKLDSDVEDVDVAVEEKPEEEEEKESLEKIPDVNLQHKEK